MSFALSGWTIVIVWMLACVLLVAAVWLLPAVLRRRHGPTLDENVREHTDAGVLDPEEYRLLLTVLRDVSQEEPVER